jgi:D-alanyl-D-alanine carboxypeptidase (penicillin-binding protein 5/6)
MSSLRYAARALALSLTLIAVGGFCMAGPSHASAADSPVGGLQLSGSGVIVNLGAGTPPPPAMPGASFLLADMDTGQILVARAPHATHLPASTMKMLTALTLIPLLNPNTSIMVKQEDVNVDGTHVGILPGTAYSVGTLMRGLLMASGNDAADALARGNQGMAVTVQEMNATATDLGASDTVARDPSGLDKADQHSSAYDLALIGRAAMRLPDFRGYVMTRQTVFPGGRSADGKLLPGFTISNHNTLLFNYRGAIGVKNGYTVAAKFTFVEAATRGGKTYLLSEMASPIGTWQPAAAMLDWAFAHGPSLTPIGALVDPGEPAVTKPTVAVFGQPDPPTAIAPRESARQPALADWIGVAGGVSALALVGGWAWRNISNKRR